MLRSFNRHFNETVFRGPDTEGAPGGDADVGGNDQDIVDTTDEGGDADVDDGSEPAEPDRKLTVREQLKKSIAEVSGEEPPAKAKRDKTTGRFGKAAKEAAPADGAPAPAPEPAPVVDTTPAPESLPKEARAAWDKAPPEIKQAFIKREQDMAAGVEQLKQKYTLIDQAIAPHTDALRQMNATPGEAVNRMFLWFKALAGKPEDAFPALAQSMGVDWNKITSKGQAPADGAAPTDPAQGGAPAIPEEVKNYVGQLQQQLQQLTQYVQHVDGRFGSVEQNLNTQNEARTRENLSIWSQGKPYFENVRQDMAKMIETGIVPLKADGQVDLDTAYERAIYFNPEVRAKVLAEQQQANQQVQQKTEQAATTAQQTQVNRARKASVSLPASTTPGAANGGIATKKKSGEKLSVRESLKAAMAELRDQ